MKEKKTGGFLLILLSAAVELAGLISFCIWSSGHNAFNPQIVAALAAGLVLAGVLCVKDMDLLVVLTAACYSFALVRLLMDSVGSFVDKFQNIVMFGDATQVNTILTIAAVMFCGLLLTVIGAFVSREKEIRP
jgi:hypothetical protein